MSDASQKPSVPSEQSEGQAPAFPIFRAPNGLEIFHHAAAETKYVYREIFEERVYFRHGINLASGESVFDVGANIGMFTLFVKENFKDVTVHAFEPSPAIFPVLKANVARYGDSVTVHACGMAGRAGEATFTYYPNYSIMSGFHAGNGQDWSMLRSGIQSYLREQAVDPAEVTDGVVDRMVKVALHQKHEYACPLRTISDVVDEGGVKAIGLLKIDAEGSELEILSGIRDEHWNGIRQIVMEIHDPGGTACPRATEILVGRGYVCRFERETRLLDSGIFNCYARRA